MLHLRLKLAAALAGACLALPVAAQDEATTADTVVATVNGTEITMGHMILARSQLPQQYAQLPTDVLFEGILDQLVQQTVLGQTVEGEPRRVRLAMENQRRTLMAGEILEDLVAEAVTDEALQAAYDEKYANAEPELEYNASHILLESQEDAQAVREELDGGADFAEVAKAKSTGPSGPNGGDLGWFGKGMMVKPFEDAVIALEPGQVSEPIETQFGWHVISLNETRVKEAPPLEEVTEELASELQRDAVDARIAELTEGAAITRTEAGTIDTSVLDDLTLLNE